MYNNDSKLNLLHRHTLCFLKAKNWEWGGFGSVVLFIFHCIYCVLCTKDHKVYKCVVGMCFKIKDSVSARGGGLVTSL